MRGTRRNGQTRHHNGRNPPGVAAGAERAAGKCPKGTPTPPEATLTPTRTQSEAEAETFLGFFFFYFAAVGKDASRLTSSSTWLPVAGARVSCFLSRRYDVAEFWRLVGGWRRLPGDSRLCGPGSLSLSLRGLAPPTRLPHRPHVVPGDRVPLGYPAAVFTRSWGRFSARPAENGPGEVRGIPAGAPGQQQGRAGGGESPGGVFGGVSVSSRG